MEAQLLKWKQAISYQHDEPSHKEPLEPVWLAIVQLGPNGSTALEVKASHFISTWWAKPQGTSGTSLVGNSAAWTQWKHSSWSESKSLHINMMSQATRNLWNQTGWKYSTCKCSLPKRKQLQRQPSKKKKNWMDGWRFSNRGVCVFICGEGTTQGG